MRRNLFVDPGYIETRVAIMENDEVVDLLFYRNEAGACLGNIYIGKVINVLPGMGAAFVDIGIEKNAYLSESDLKDELYISNTKYGTDLLKEGREVMVQVQKEPSGNKGAKITMNITLPGKHTVYIPFSNTLGVSNKINDSHRVEELKKLSEKLKPDEAGLIIRTLAKDAENSDIEEDVNYLKKLWENILKSARTGNVPRCLYDDTDPIGKIVRELLNDDTDKLYINSQIQYEKIYEILGATRPEHRSKLNYYNKDYDMFEFFKIENEIDKALAKKVWLKSGGYLIFDSTEALTIIDVNSGKYIGKKEFNQTILNINLEAAEEIARQVRLRNIGGIIIIDFIDMVSEEDKEKILLELETNLKKDRTPSVVVGITKLGLVEMTRKKTSPSLNLLLRTECRRCYGTGRTVNTESIIAEIEKRLKVMNHGKLKTNITMKINSDMAKLLKHDNKNHIAALCNYYEINIYLETDDSIQFGVFHMN